MPYNKQVRTNFGGANTGTPPYGNFFGYGSLGDVTYSSTTSLVNSASDSGIFESHYASLTVNSSVTLSSFKIRIASKNMLEPLCSSSPLRSPACDKP